MVGGEVQDPHRHSTVVEPCQACHVPLPFSNGVLVLPKLVPLHETTRRGGMFPIVPRRDGVDSSGSTYIKQHLCDDKVSVARGQMQCNKPSSA
jgi:hypothetical protein